MKFGVIIFPNKPIAELVKFYTMADAAGMHYSWVPDEMPSYPFRDPYAIMAAVGHATRSIKIGTSISVPYTRHPALLAAAMKSYDELFPGRMILGIGPGGVLTLKPLKLKIWDRPMLAMRESVEISHRLFMGEEVTFDGKVFQLEKTKLYAKPAEPIPIFLAARGPKMIQLAGEVADGGIFNLQPKVIPWGIKQLQLGAKKSGRSLSSFTLSSSIPLIVAKTREEARSQVIPKLCSAVNYANPIVHKLLGVDLESIQRLKEATGSGWGGTEEFITDEMLDLYSIYGTPDEVIEQLRQYERAGVQVYNFGPGSPAQMQLIIDEILPAFQE